jgi:hypothetical protein
MPLEASGFDVSTHLNFARFRLVRSSAYSAASCTNALSAMDLDLRVKNLQDA